MGTANIIDGTGLAIHVYDITMLAGDTSLVIESGAMQADTAVITPKGADAAGCYTQHVRLGSLAGSTVTIAKDAGAPLSAHVTLLSSFVDKT